MVVRCFEDPNITHVEGAPDPLRDIEIVTIEMALADLATLGKRRDRLAREVRANPKQAPQLAALDNLVAALEANRPARSFAPDSLELAMARESFLLSAKPMLYVANIDEAQITAPGPMVAAVFAHAAGGEQPRDRVLGQNRIGVRRPQRRGREGVPAKTTASRPAASTG